MRGKGGSVTSDRDKHHVMRAGARERWSDLRDEDFEDWQGDRQSFVSKLEQRLGMQRGDAEAAADDLARTVQHQWGDSTPPPVSGDSADDLARTVEHNI